MRSAHLRFSTDILKRLGEELNQDVDQGILELVKNAYDADARNCTVEIVDTEPFFDREHERGKIVVSDDGSGMNRDDILDGWLVLGRSMKSPGELTPKYGRARIGSKGLGRLSALRMGGIANLETRPESDPDHQYELTIDWSQFEKTDVVDDVGLEIKRKRRGRGSTTGTTVTISRLGKGVTRVNAKRLARGLILLADPFGEDPVGFQPRLIAPEFEDLEGIVQRKYYEDAEFHLCASVGNDGRAQAEVRDYNGDVLYSAQHKELVEKRGGSPSEYACPGVQFDLWVFLLQKNKFILRTGSLTQVREWLSQLGGVHLYERGVRIAPYGDPGNDWLDINLMRARSPEERPSTNTSIGRIRIDDPGDSLIQKTDRSGLIENEAFAELRRFAKNALDWMARRRLKEREAKRAFERTETAKKKNKVQKKLKDAVAALDSESREDIEKLISGYERAQERQVKALQDEVQLYRTLSTAGITAAIFFHESPIKTITGAAAMVSRRGKRHFPDLYDKHLGDPVGRISRSAKALEIRGGVTLSLIESQKRRPRRVDIYPEIESVLQTFKSFLEQRKVTVIRELVKGNPYLRATKAAIESIFANILNNSFAWFEGYAQENRKIVIRSEFDGSSLLNVHILDNGPGIKEVSLKDIWLPGVSTRPNGTGLGLTIVKDTVQDLGGEVRALESGALGGAEFIITLPILGA